MTTINLADAGFKSLNTVGQMTAGSSQLTVTSNSGFHVGDSIIVAVGGEAGQGQRGTAGVGGVYAAATNDPNLYYTNTDAPKALVAHIVSVGADGHTLILDRPASTSTSGASVYFDNKPVWDAVMAANTGPNVTLDIPAGHFAISDAISVNYRPGWTVEGAGKGQTELFSPPGAPSASLGVFESHNVTLQDFSLTGNAKLNGYGLGGASKETYPPGIMFTSSDHGLAQNLTVTDVFQDAVGTRYSNDTWAYRVDAHLTEGLARYIQWQFDWANSTGGGVVDSSVTSPTLTAGFEAFSSSNTSFIGVHGTNASMAMNSAGGFLIKDAVLTVTPNSWSSDLAFHRNNPLIDINSNISKTDPLLGIGGQILNTTMIQEGYINSNGNILKGISIGGDNQNIVVTGGAYVSPDINLTANDKGALGLTSWGQNTVVDGFTVVGAAFNNIDVHNGIVKNSIAGSILSTSASLINNSTPSSVLLDHAAELVRNPDSILVEHNSPVTSAQSPAPAPVPVTPPTVPAAPTPALPSVPTPVTTAPVTTTPTTTVPHDTTDTSGHGDAGGAVGGAWAHLAGMLNGAGSNTSMSSALQNWANQHSTTQPTQSSVQSTHAPSGAENDPFHAVLQSWACTFRADNGDANTNAVHTDPAIDHPVALGWHLV